jgi:hypothetical protein
MTTRKSYGGIRARTLLTSMLIGALLAWGGLLLFTRYVPPQGVPAFLVFFVLLGVALLCTLTLLIYLITLAILVRRARRPRLSLALRQGGLISAWLLFNLLLRALHSWSIFTAAVSFGIIVVIEFLALER